MGMKRGANQRDTMRAIFARHRGNRERVVSEYAAAERRGEVARKSNTSGITAEEYASALLYDGLRKGWVERWGCKPEPYRRDVCCGNEQVDHV